jgi:hypothetical protein
VSSGQNESSSIHINITLFISEIPILQSDQIKYFYNLKSAIRNFLNLSSQWEIFSEVIDMDTSTARRSGQYSNFWVNIIFSSAFVGPQDSDQLRRKLDSVGFLNALNAMGFKASRYSVPSIQDDSGSNLASSSVVIAVCSVFGFVLGVAVLGFLRRLRARNKDRTQTADCKGKMLGENKKSGKDYSKEYDEVLQLLSRLQISVSWLVDAYLRQALEARIEASEEISAYDRAAALQLLGGIELDEDLADQSSDRKTLLEQRITRGPFMEIHLRILKQICRTDTLEILFPKSGNSHDFICAPDESCKPTSEMSTMGEFGLSDSYPTAAPPRPLQDVLFLLKTCDLDPSDLMQKESRSLMEEILITRQGPLQAVHLAVLQLLSKAEIDSDLSIGTERKRLLEKRIGTGPLSADHLSALRALRMLGSEELSHGASVYPSLIPETGASSASSHMSAVVLDHGAGVVQQQQASEIYSCDAVFSPRDSAEMSEARRFMDKIYRDQSSLILFGGEEKSALLQVSSTAVPRRQAAYGALRRKEPSPILSNGASDLTESSLAVVTPQRPLQDVLFLLKTCDLDPSDLMQKESRSLMEEILITRQGPLQAVHMAVLQILSKAEIDSDLSIGTERKRLLEKRIGTGPLSADHLRKVQALRMLGMLGRGRGGEARRDSPMLNEPGASSASGRMSAVMLDHGAAAVQQQESSEICSSDLVFVRSNGVITQDHSSSFFMDNIYGLEIMPSVQSREEKSALQLIELRAKTASIRRSLPDWVRNGLMPPRHDPSPPAKLLSDVFDTDTHGDAVQISCEVLADLGFLMASEQQSSPPAASNPRPDLQSLFLRVEVGGNAVAEEILPITEWQEATVLSKSPTLQDRPRSNTWISFTWICNTLQYLSFRLLGLLDACCRCALMRWLACRRAETE